MKCRKSARKLIQEYNAAAAPDKPNTALIKFRNAVVALKAAPSLLPPPHTLLGQNESVRRLYSEKAGRAATQAVLPTAGASPRGPERHRPIRDLSGVLS